MRFEPRHLFRDDDPAAPAIAPHLAVLRFYRRDGEAVLAAATAAARTTGVDPVEALVAGGEVDAETYYAALAAHLGVPFVETWPILAPVPDPAAAMRRGRAEFNAPHHPRLLLAPDGRACRLLVRAKQAGFPLSDIAITTPSRFAGFVEWRAQHEIERIACDRLPETRPRLSARDAVRGRGGLVVAAVLCLSSLLLAAMPTLFFDAVCLAFFAATCFRVCVCAFGDDGPPAPPPSDAALPTYSVLVPLHDEAGMVGDLLAALDALDYPRAKLEVLVLVEAEDHATQAALAAHPLPPYLRVVVAPLERTLRTKPRALNVGLVAARGDLVTVYDAEDRPAPDQLRRAAALFSIASPRLACLQARLAIGNGDDGWLPRLFALEYATLFDRYNPGATALALPVALGGTSNHFRGLMAQSQDMISTRDQ